MTYGTHDGKLRQHSRNHAARPKLPAYLAFCKPTQTLIAAYPNHSYPNSLLCPHCQTSQKLYQVHRLNSIRHLSHFVVSKHQRGLLAALRVLGWTMELTTR